MINPAPFNAEAPPEALAGEITPVELHYVRSNFAVPTPRRHARSRRCGRQPDQAHTRRPARDAGGRARRDARMCRERAPRDAAAAGRRAMGRLRGLDRPVEGRPPARGARARPPGSGRRRGPLRRRRPRPVSPQAGACGDQPVRPALRALARPRPRNRSGGRDPDRLRDERPAADPRPRSPLPADRAPLVRRRLREMAEADRRPDRTVRGRVSDRPLHLRMAGSRARTRHPDARPRPHHRPRPRRDDRHRRVHRTRKGVVRHRTGHRRRTSASPARETGTRRSSSPRRVRTNGRTGRSTGRRPTSADTPFAPEQPTRPATCNPTSRPGTGSATETTQSRSPTSTCADAVRRRSVCSR